VTSSDANRDAKPFNMPEEEVQYNDP